MRKFGYLFFIAVFCSSSLLADGLVVNIEKSAGSGKTGISLSEVRATGSAAQTFMNVLHNDLLKSGWFVPGNNQYNSFRITGNIAGNSATELRMALQIATPKGSFMWSETSTNDRDLRWSAHRLSDAIVKNLTGRNGMAASRIAFIGKQGGAADVFLCDSDGNYLTRLTHDNVPALSPYFAPDGNFIYYTSFIKQYPCVYRAPVNAAGGAIPLANFTGLNTGGAVSPDGKYIAVILSAPGNPELYIINTITRRPIRLTRTPRAAEASPCWSPDGENIAYVSDESGTPQVYIMDSHTKKARRVSFEGSQNVAPSWGADGRLAYCTKRGASYQIAVLDPKSGKSEVVTSGADHEDPSWAPDGRHIICSRATGGAGSALFVVDTMGDPPQPLFSRAGTWRAPDWSPNLANR